LTPRFSASSASDKLSTLKQPKRAAVRGVNVPLVVASGPSSDDLSTADSSINISSLFILGVSIEVLPWMYISMQKAV